MDFHIRNIRVYIRVFSNIKILITKAVDEGSFSLSFGVIGEEKTEEKNCKANVHYSQINTGSITE